MKFGSCRVFPKREIDENGHRESFEIFDSYAVYLKNQVNCEKRFAFGEYTVILRGISEDYKIFFSHSKLDNCLVGERVFGNDIIKNHNVFNQMMEAFRDNNITFE